jgi:hypothetical protein
MALEETAMDDASPNQKPWYQLGSAAALVLGVGYIAIFPLYAHVGAPPSGGEAWFRYLPGKTTAWWAILSLSVFTDLLYIPLAFALYLALRKINRNAMLLAAAFMSLFVALDLAVTWTHYASILVLHARYTAATDDVRRAAYLAAAEYASAMLSSPLEVVYAIVILSFGILLTGFVMRKGVFDQATAYLGVATGILGIASLTRVGPVIIGNAIFATVWLFFVSYRLYRLAQN